MDRKKVFRNVGLIAVILLLVAGFSFFGDDTRGYAKVDTSVAVKQITDGNVSSATVEDREQRLRLELKNPVPVGDSGETSSKVMAQYPAEATDAIFTDLVNAEGEGASFDTVVSQDSVLGQMLIYLVPMLLFFVLFLFISAKMRGSGGGIMGFGKTKANAMTKDMPETRFSDVAGEDEAVGELAEIKDFLQYPGRYQALGAKIPRGVLLYGPPGTGKTLLARAVAGEAGVPFYSISGSDFVEMFVGVGASRVRDLFAQARKNNPCIIFIDEIDAVGRQRGAGMGGGHDEREQTLNQLLVEMDGFSDRESIILIAATNRPDVLDPALLRPGRFDRQIPVVNPDVTGRKQILRVHAEGKPMGPDVDLDGLATRTAGMSGADLANVVNEAALLTARANGNVITADALEEATDRVLGGPRRTSKVITEQEKKVTAYHEAGHTLAAWAMPGLEKVYKVTILPRGRTGGFAMLAGDDDKGLHTRSELLSRIVFALGGRSAEELVFHEPTTGASNDIESATNTARAMVMKYGMTANLGAVHYGDDEGDPFLGRDMGKSNSYSHEIAQRIDEEVRSIIEVAHKEAWSVLREYRDELDALAALLLEKETVRRPELEEILGGIEKRPRITDFDDFGERTPSDRPPVKTPRELAEERGEPWPPVPEPDPMQPPQAHPLPEAAPSPSPSLQPPAPVPAPGSGTRPPRTPQESYPVPEPGHRGGHYPDYGTPLPPDWYVPGWPPAQHDPSATPAAGGPYPAGSPAGQDPAANYPVGESPAEPRGYRLPERETYGYTRDGLLPDREVGGRHRDGDAERDGFPEEPDRSAQRGSHGDGEER